MFAHSDTNAFKGSNLAIWLPHDAISPRNQKHIQSSFAFWVCSEAPLFFISMPTSDTRLLFRYFKKSLQFGCIMLGSS